MNLVERFLNYTTFDTQSAEDSQTVPSTQKQLLFAEYLKKELEEFLPRVREIPFDSDRKMMTTFHRGMQGKTVSFTKGAPDEIWKRCAYIRTKSGEERITDMHRRELENAVRGMSTEALRVMAVAMYKGTDGPVEEDLTFLGLVGMRDPVRPEAVEAVEKFREFFRHNFN